MKPGMGWPIGIVAILGASVVGNLIMMRIANSDPSFAVEPDYYERAVAFDSTIAEERKSHALGWSASSTITGMQQGRARLRVHLQDQNGQPIVADSVLVVAMFNARANDRVSATLVAAKNDAGNYDAAIPVTRAGQWEVRVDARRGSDHFVTTTRTEATTAVGDTTQPK